MSSPRKLTYEPFADATGVFALEGEWDLTGNDQFTEAVGAAVADGRTRLVIDLGAVTYFDSSMLGSLLSLQKMAEANGWPLSFVRPETPPVWRLFQLTALDHRFTFFDSRVDALAARPNGFSDHAP